MHVLNATPILIASTILLGLFAIVATVDGLYLHLYKYRLHARPDSYREHLWHTGRAILFVPALILVWASPTAGGLLWIGVGLVAVDLVLEIGDMLGERASRATLGGLSTFEYAVHGVAVTLHASSLALALITRPATAWSWTATESGVAYPAWIETAVHGLVPGAVAVAIIHVAFAIRHRPAVGSGLRRDAVSMGAS